jgi:hypothetical protein
MNLYCKVFITLGHFYPPQIKPNIFTTSPSCNTYSLGRGLLFTKKVFPGFCGIFKYAVNPQSDNGSGKHSVLFSSILPSPYFFKTV